MIVLALTLYFLALAAILAALAFSTEGDLAAERLLANEAEERRIRAAQDALERR